MNQTLSQLSQAIARLMQAQADYQAFVKTTRSYQLAIEGARHSARLAARADLALQEAE